MRREATRFKAARINAGMTQRELAGAVGVLESDIHRLEYGYWDPASEMRSKLCRAIEVPLHAVFDDRGAI